MPRKLARYVIQVVQVRVTRSISIAFVQSPTLNIENAVTPPSPSLQSRLQVEQVKYEIIEKPPAIVVEVQINIYTYA